MSKATAWVIPAMAETEPVITSLSSILTTITDLPPRKEKARPPSTEEEITALKEQAKQDGFVAGYAEGHRAGLETGHEEGFTAGHAEGLKRAYDGAAAAYAETLEEFKRELAELVGKIETAIPLFFDNKEEEMADLAMETVRSVLSTELSLSRDSALAISREMLREVTHAEHVRIRLNPYDSAMLSQHRDDLKAVSMSVQAIEFVDDSNIEGGCIIESAGGVIDATVTTRLQLVEEAWKDAA